MKRYSFKKDNISNCFCDMEEDDDGQYILCETNQDAMLAEVEKFIKKSFFISDLINSHSVYHDEVDEWNELLNRLSEAIKKMEATQ